MALSTKNAQTPTLTSTGGPQFAGVSFDGTNILEIVRIGIGTAGDSVETLVDRNTGLPVTQLVSPWVVTPLAKTTFSFRSQFNSTQTNTSLSFPGASFRITFIAVDNATTSNTTFDNPSIRIGIDPSATPSNAQVLLACAGLAPGQYRFASGDFLAGGGATDHVFLTTGTISNDVIEVYGAGYLL
jgi:hypothetical protein